MSYWIGVVLVVILVPLGAFIARRLEDFGKEVRAKRFLIGGYWLALAVAIGMIINLALS